MIKYFCFIPGLRGPEGQILYDLPVSGEGKSTQKYLMKPLRLNEWDCELSLDQLIVKFRDRLPNATQS